MSMYTVREHFQQVKMDRKEAKIELRTMQQRET